MNITHIIQVKWVFPGVFGGAIFKGVIIGTRSVISVKASYKVIVRAPIIGEFWQVTGAIIRHTEYGNQLHATNCTLSQLPKPSYISSLLTYHPAFRGFHFGKAKVKRLITQIGGDALVDLLNNKQTTAISDIISPAIATRLVIAWTKLQNEVEAISFLHEHNFDAALSRKILKLTRNNTIERLKNNPYALICFGSISKNIWRTLDSVARKMSIPKNDDRRLVAAVEHVLYQRLRDGHTATQKAKLISSVDLILKNTDLTLRAIAAALRNKSACIVIQNDAEYFQAIGPAYIEHSIEQRLERLINKTTPNSFLKKYHAHISLSVKRHSIEFERYHKFSLTEQQTQAITLALTERCALISGYGGTGKTTILRAIVDIATATNRLCYLLALSGKAKERLAEATNREAMTIHYFIKAVKESDQTIDIRSDPLIIVDECSMVDIALFNKLLALFDGLPFSLLTVGDTAQLSPVGFGLVWHRMAKSGCIKSVHLTNVHRQSADSPINQVAMKIRNAELTKLEKWNGEATGIYLVETSIDKLVHEITQLKMALPNAQVLTPHMSIKMADSGHVINATLQEKLNPLMAGKRGLIVGATHLREGDPVLVTENCYELGLFNGMTGKLLKLKLNSIGQQCGEFAIDSQEYPIELTVDQLFDIGIQLAYAISIHKSQGSEYDEAIICCASSSKFIERSLIYTAVTRARRLCILLGSQHAFDTAITNTPRADSLCVGIDL